ncbi:MAG TPA: hypothetical protein VL128_17140 [Candidatus Eisenbacteria bacterium]|nr:hypothetical protein [Candidatus Eisenbacteria bacterium]
MISRSDGKNFHLLLADRPVPFPAERREGPSREFSVCFWYCLGEQKKETKSSLVLVPAESKGHGDLYREIESIADLLVKKLLERKKLAVLYNLQGNSLRELGY